MEKADILIRALEPEIDMKCTEIEQKKKREIYDGNICFNRSGYACPPGDFDFLRRESVHGIYSGIIRRCGLCGSFTHINKQRSGTL